MNYLLKNTNNCVQQFTTVHLAQELANSKPNQNPQVTQSYNRVLVLYSYKIGCLQLRLLLQKRKCEECQDINYWFFLAEFRATHSQD